MWPDTSGHFIADAVKHKLVPAASYIILTNPPTSLPLIGNRWLAVMEGLKVLGVRSGLWHEFSLVNDRELSKAARDIKWRLLRRAPLNSFELDLDSEPPWEGYGRDEEATTLNKNNTRKERRRKESEENVTHQEALRRGSLSPRTDRSAF